jgi:PAS domain S-box-containing protein
VKLIGAGMAERIEILLVEDDLTHVELIQRAFEDRDDQIQITLAQTIAEARARLASSSPDLILADWRLPDGDSLSLFPSDQYNNWHIPIVIMTSYGNESIAVDAMKAGALDYVVKSSETFMDMPHIVERSIQQWKILAERERIQEMLRESEAKFRLLAENSTDLISRLDVKGVCLYASPACRALLGYEPRELIGHDAGEFIHQDDLGEAKRIFRDIVPSSGAVITFTCRVRKKNNQYIWLESIARNISDEARGGSVEIHISSRDVTQRKKAELDLQNAHRALEEAYEATLNGWSRALELRDRETEGHSRRVMEMTLRLARAVGIPQADLAYIHWGVLLHDIGKLGVLDEILRKPGPLTDAEWVEMRRHPEYALDMLSPINYLRPSLDIPYSHHEKWDGTGYPRHLKGEEIPLAARVFAIVDVWDALSNDRPYRKALPPDQVSAYIRDNAGRHFDPRLVDLFLSIVETQPIPL